MKKKLLALLLMSVMVLSLAACGGKSDTPSDTPENKEPATEDAAKEADAEEEAEQNIPIELIAGEQGEYGKTITMNEGTDMEESFYVYYVPAGSYTAKNVGEYMTQVSVYEGFAKNEESGYDEYTNAGNVVLLDIGKEAPIEIPDGWFIEIQEPAHISLILADNE